MKHLYKLLAFAIVLVWTVEPLMAQQEVTVRELNTYDEVLDNQDEIPNHPYWNESDATNPTEVTFDAVVIAYPRNSGLATADQGETEAEPGRIHLYVEDVNAVDMGRDGMSMQIVVEGSQRNTLEGLARGDVIRVTGFMTSYFSTIQFNATDVEFLGFVETGGGYEHLSSLLEPTVIDLSEINQPSPNGNTHRWVAENYTKYIHRYVKFEGLEVLQSDAQPSNDRPWVLFSDGNTVLYTNDMSLRYRNDKGTYGFEVVEDEDSGVQDTVLTLGYNYRRLDESLDGPYTPPASGSVVDVSGFVLVSPSFDPADQDESFPQSTLRIIPWEDGIRWTADGTDTENRITEGIPDDMVVRGFAPTLDQFSAIPATVTTDDQVTLSIDVLKPEEDYTLKSVKLAYSDYPYTAQSGDTTIVDMTANGDTYTYTLDTFEAFTTVDYTITAVTETPDGVETSATQNGSFTVKSTTQTAPVSFSPSASETYGNSVTVSMNSSSEDATIYYTLDGTTPDESSTEYSDAIRLTETSTIKAVAKAPDLDLSPVNEVTYNVEVETNEVATLAAIRDGSTSENYTYTGEAVVTFTQSYRNQKYLMDSSGGLLIDDAGSVITSSYSIGDIMTGLRGDLGSYNGVSQIVPSADPGSSPNSGEVNPVEMALADIDRDQHESMLITIEGVSFEETGAFEAGENYTLTDGSLSEGETFAFRTNFTEADYIGGDIPTGTFKLTAIVGAYFGTPQLVARSSEDFDMGTSNEADELPQEFVLEQNYPNPFNPTTVIRYSVADVANVKLQVFDVLGRKVATLVNEVKTPGAYSVNFDARNLSSGTYFYRIDAGDFSTIKKMMLIK